MANAKYVKVNLSLVMPNCNPRDRFLDQYLTLMKDSLSIHLMSILSYGGPLYFICLFSIKHEL